MSETAKRNAAREAALAKEPKVTVRAKTTLPDGEELCVATVNGKRYAVTVGETAELPKSVAVLAAQAGLIEVVEGEEPVTEPVDPPATEPRGDAPASEGKDAGDDSGKGQAGDGQADSGDASKGDAPAAV